jgi:hypothetical protein
VKDLEDAFGWNLVTESAFKEVKLPKSLIKSVTKEFANAVKALFQKTAEKASENLQKDREGH